MFHFNNILTLTIFLLLTNHIVNVRIDSTDVLHEYSIKYASTGTLILTKILLSHLSFFKVSVTESELVDPSLTNLEQSHGGGQLSLLSFLLFVQSISAIFTFQEWNFIIILQSCLSLLPLS